MALAELAARTQLPALLNPARVGARERPYRAAAAGVGRVADQGRAAVSGQGDARAETRRGGGVVGGHRDLILLLPARPRTGTKIRMMRGAEPPAKAGRLRTPTMATAPSPDRASG